MIGFLDKGGKWRMKDWYLRKNTKDEKIDAIREEIKRV